MVGCALEESITTAHGGFAERQGHSAKDSFPSTKALLSTTLGKGLPAMNSVGKGIFVESLPSGTWQSLCRGPRRRSAKKSDHHHTTRRDEVFAKRLSE